MLISWKWLTSLVDLPEGVTLDPEALAALLTGVGLEVDAVASFGAGVESILVGELRSKAPHPDADRLTLVELFDGAAIQKVVCGASNLPEVGGKVAFAPVGARLPGGMEIGAREVRGAPSAGMICSEEELEIGSEGGGILVLPSAWEAGDRLIDRVPEITDTVLEIGVTPNRPDALGHVGVARDVAVKLGGSLRLPELRAPEVPTTPEILTLEAADRCGRYFGYVLDGVKVGASPLWMRVRLHRLGLRAINNCVDITNYVLMEQGHPLHVFDRDRLAQGRVVIRRAGEGEAFAALDGSEHELCAEDLVIADAEIPQALAGVMGGGSSMVHGGTAQVLLEAAWFTPTYIRASAGRHALHSDSSYRFERGVDHGEGLERAGLRALNLLETHAGATCRAQAEVVGERPKPPRIDLRLSRVHHLLGMPVHPDEAERVLKALGVEVLAHPRLGGAIPCVAPTHRPDLHREVDLIEELMRFHGLEDLPAEASIPSAPIVETVDPRAEIRERLADALCEVGLHEHLSYAFTHPEKLEPFLSPQQTATIVALANPLRKPLSVMRTHLLPDLLDALDVNVARHPHPVRLFSLGRVYAWPEGQAPTQPAPVIDPRRAAPIETIDELLPVEREEAAILLHGGDNEDGRCAVGVLVQALERLGYEPRVEAIAAEDRIRYLHPGVQAAILVREGESWGRVGHVGELHPDIASARNLGERAKTFVGVIELGQLPSLPVPVARERPRFPATSRDLSLELPTTVPAVVVVDTLVASGARAFEAAQIEASASASAAKKKKKKSPPELPRLLEDGIAPCVEIVEDYRGAGIDEGRRALLLRLHYGAPGRSVTDKEIQALHDQIVQGACEELGSDVHVR